MIIGQIALATFSTPTGLQILVMLLGLLPQNQVIQLSIKAQALEILRQVPLNYLMWI